MHTVDGLVTVYIPSHNYGNFLKGAIESILNQTYEKWELLVINDGSNDNTSDIMSQYSKNPKIKLFYTDCIGLPAVCNFALKKANGEFIIRLDADDLANENMLFILTNYLFLNSKLACVYPDYYFIDEFNDIFAHKIRSNVNKEVAYEYPPNGACTLIRKHILIEVGGYREDLGAQDGFDFWTKIVKNHETKNINLPLFYYRRHDQNLTNNTTKIQHAKRIIKKDFVIGQLNNFYPITAIIPCRTDYDFLPSLWSKKINSKALLDLGIESCANSKLINKIIITCDDEKVEEYIKNYNDDKISFIKRSKKSTIRNTKLLPLISKFINSIDPQLNGITLIRYIQSPFVTSQSLDEIITTLIMNNADAAYGVEKINSKLFKKTNEGLIPINPDREIIPEFDDIYLESNTVNAILNKSLTNDINQNKKISCIEISKPECFFIDSDKDLQIANFIDKKK